MNGVDIDCYAPSNYSDLEDYINFLREASAVFRPAGILLGVALHHQQYPGLVHLLVVAPLHPPPLLLLHYLFLQQ
jgi:hypothetical protein